MPVTIVVTIMSRMRISLVIIQRIPAHVVAERDVEHKCDERRAPPAPLLVELAARGPRPIAVVIDPAPVVIRGPAPRLITNPRPAVRRTPGPMTVAIRRPVSVDAEGTGIWPPDPAVVVCVDPVAVSIEIFSTNYVLVELLPVRLSELGVILFALLHPLINRIGQ